MFLNGQMPHRFLQDSWRGAAALYDWGNADQGLKPRQKLYLLVDALTPPLFLVHTVMGEMLKSLPEGYLSEAKNLVEVLQRMFPHLLGLGPVKVAKVAISVRNFCYAFSSL